MLPESCKSVWDAARDVPVKGMPSYDVDYARLELHPNFFESIEGNKTEDIF